MINKDLRHAGLCLALFVACAAYSQQVTPGCPGPATGAFTACYYANQSLSGAPALVRTDAQINFNWANGSPAPSITPDDFSATWQGNFTFTGGKYVFSITASDGMRVYVDGGLVLSAWRNQAPSYYTATQTIAAGVHLIGVQYYDAEGGATAQLSWKNVGGAPSSSPAPTGGGTAATSPTGPSLLAAVAKSGNEVDLLWTASSDPSGIAGYQVLRNGVMVSSVPGNLLLYDDNSASPGTAYTYTIVAFDAAGNKSLPSNPIQVATPAAAAPPGACPGPANNAFTGCYYPNITLTGNPTFVRTDPQINFDWGNRSPDASLPAVNFSALWQGNFAFGQGSYTFTLLTSDGVRVYIDGAMVFNQWIDQSPTAFTFSRAMSAGAHLINVQYFEQTGGATAQISWKASSSTAPSFPQSPVISSFTANPSNATPGATVRLSWNASGASSLSISGVGDVTGTSSVTVAPSATTVYTLTATNAVGSATAALTVNVNAASGPVGTGPVGRDPATPTLVSAIAKSATEVDLAWTASSDALGIDSYQILRNGFPVATVAGSALAYADTSVSGGEVLSYSVKAFDPSGSYSAPSNIIQVTTPSPTGVSVTWYAPCWVNGTVEGVTGSFQAVDFDLISPTPVAIQGTLFYVPNCNASGGDNLNDFYSLTDPGNRVIGFSHNVNVQPVSAMYWVGAPTPDGHCPAGSTTCSGCLNYNSATLSCSVLP